MTQEEAQLLIREGVQSKTGTWADIGAGTGTFTLALQELLTEGVIYAVDKNPHVLWSLRSAGPVSIEVVEADFTRPFELPPLDGVVMANALHYTQEPAEAVKHITANLKPGGAFILIEYETRRPRPPWVPYPLPFSMFREIALESWLTEPQKIAEVPSRYGHDHIYSALCFLRSA